MKKIIKLLVVFIFLILPQNVFAAEGQSFGVSPSYADIEGKLGNSVEFKFNLVQSSENAKSGEGKYLIKIKGSELITNEELKYVELSDSNLVLRDNAEKSIICKINIPKDIPNQELMFFISVNKVVETSNSKNNFEILIPVSVKIKENLANVNKKDFKISNLNIEDNALDVTNTKDTIFKLLTFNLDAWNKAINYPIKKINGDSIIYDKDNFSDNKLKLTFNNKVNNNNDFTASFSGALEIRVFDNEEDENEDSEPIRENANTLLLKANSEGKLNYNIKDKSIKMMISSNHATIKATAKHNISNSVVENKLNVSFDKFRYKIILIPIGIWSGCVSLLLLVIKVRKNFLKNKIK